MTERLYPEDPLTPEERDELEGDLIAFCDRELALLGEIRGLDVLYAGGVSALWLEGLSQRIGASGRLTALEADAARVREGEDALESAGLDAPVRIIVGSVFEPPFAPGSFDLVYSAGLFHELDVRWKSAGDALSALVSVTRPGGRVATSDFVDTASSVQLEDEELQRELAQQKSGAKLYGTGSPERLAALHEFLLHDVWWQVLPPFGIRHLDKVVLAEGEDAGWSLPPGEKGRLRGRLESLRRRIRREGYTRPATMYVEGRRRFARR